MSRKFKSLKKKQHYKVNNHHPGKGVVDTKLRMLKVKSSLNSKKIKEFYKNSNSSLSKNRISTSGKFPVNISPINGFKLYEDYRSHLKRINDTFFWFKFDREVMPDRTLEIFSLNRDGIANDPELIIADAIPFFKLFKMYENFKNFGMDDLIKIPPKDIYSPLFKTEFPLMKNIINAYSFPPRNDMEKYRVAILKPSNPQTPINTHVYFKFEKSSFSGSSRGLTPIQIKILWIYSKNPHNTKEIYYLMLHFYYLMRHERQLRGMFTDEPPKPSFITFDPEFYNQFKDSDMFKHIRDIFGYSIRDIGIDKKGVELFIIPLHSRYNLKNLTWGKDLIISDTPPREYTVISRQNISQDLRNLFSNLVEERFPNDYSIFLIEPSRNFFKYNHTVPIYKKVIKILNLIYQNKNELFKEHLILIVNKRKPKNILEEYFLEGFLTFRVVSPKVARLKCLHSFIKNNPKISSDFSEFATNDFTLTLLVILNNMNINICITDFINKELIKHFETMVHYLKDGPRGSDVKHHHKTGFNIEFYLGDKHLSSDRNLIYFGDRRTEKGFDDEHNYQFFFIRKLNDQNNYTNLINNMKKNIISKNRLRNRHDYTGKEWFHGGKEKKIPMKEYKIAKDKNVNNIHMKRGLDLFLNLKKYGGTAYPFRYNIYVPDFYPRFESYEAYLNFESKLKQHTRFKKMVMRRRRKLPVRPNFMDISKI